MAITGVIPIILISILFLTITIQGVNIKKGVTGETPDEQYLNFTEITAKHGYASEEHTVETEDGYLLTIFRMLKGKKCEGQVKRPPVILQHGLLLSADVWLDAGTDHGLPFLLADSCFDLWIGNQRGNYYARKHVFYDPDNDSEFWQFTNDDIGYFDIPATIDYVLNYTKAKRVNHIGFSQGGGTLYIMCSERPEYCKKVNFHISLAPATRHLNTKAVGFRKVSIAFNILNQFLEDAGIHEVLGRGGPTQTFFKRLCKNDIAYDICSMAEAIFDGYDPGSISPETQKMLFRHFPAGTSTQNMAKYGQAMYSTEFMKFDYGMFENLKMYKSVKPPVYKLSAVKIPVVVIYGLNDGIVDKDDVRWVISQLPNVTKVYEIEHSNWTHFDFTHSKFTTKYLSQKIIKNLKLYSSK